LNIFNYYITRWLHHQILQVSEGGNVSVAETCCTKN